MQEELKNVRKVYFIGIGGIGMSAIARYFRAKGAEVSGYDKTPTDLSKALEAEGIQVFYDENTERIPKDADLVVYTPAVPAEHRELVFFRENNYRLLKRSDVLKLITESSFNICIAGTHGKTTITTMVAHILRDSGYGCTAFLGGISVNYDTNFWMEKVEGNKNVCVVEADEYDRSFLKLSPDIAVITAMDPDHLDIYGSMEAMEQAFIDFSKRLKPTGKLFVQFGLKRGSELGDGILSTYSLQNESADVYAKNIMMKDGSYFFDIQVGEKSIEGIMLHMGGMHNVENAVAAVSATSSLDLEEGKIRKAIENFRGVKRRFEYIIKNKRLVFIDDYAHHPEELRALIQSAKTLFWQRKCTVIFQPHLYTRTRDLADGFGEVLDLADEVILLPVYPARELPLAGVNSGLILDKMKKGNKKIMDKQVLLKWAADEYSKKLDREFGAILITAGAGDIDLLIEPLKSILKNI